MRTVAIVDYGSGNLHSVARAIDRVGGTPNVTGADAEIRSADAVVIPGVGHFGHCVRAIRDRGLDDTIRAAVDAGRPVVGVCVGMQVLFDGSDEDPGEPGLGLVPSIVRRLPDGVRVPHMGWNTVRWRSPHPLVDGLDDDTSFYFVHSFAPDPDDSTVGVATHGRAFAAAAAADNVFATQFHPEKSGDAGLQIYENLVKALA